MHPETERDLAEIERLHEEIRSLYRTLQHIKDSCTHKDFSLNFVETLWSDAVPSRVCVVCDKRLPGITREEEEQLRRDIGGEP